MAGLFRRKRKAPEHAEDLLTPHVPEQRRVGEYAPYVPASVRAPEMQRFANFDHDDDDDDDGDIAFLEGLANQIPDREPAKRQPAPGSDDAPPQAALLRAKPVVKRDNMQMFRDTPLEEDKPEIAKIVHIEDTDMGDLLESMHTVAAALRRRRAA